MPGIKLTLCRIYHDKPQEVMTTELEFMNLTHAFCTVNTLNKDAAVYRTTYWIPQEQLDAATGEEKCQQS